MSHDPTDILKIKLKESFHKKEDEDIFLKSVRNHGFKPGGYKAYYKLQNTKNDLDMLLD